MVHSRVRIRPFLELARVHLSPTAVADSFTGYCLAVTLQDKVPSCRTIIGIASASILIYSMGMVTNDILDQEKDRDRDPGRPLASGALGIFAAISFAAVLAVGGALAALSAGEDAALAALGLMALALLYNLGAKRIPVLGNLLMGSCRSANLLMGSLAAIPLRQIAVERGILLAAGILGIYIAGVTAVSLLEDSPPRLKPFLGATVPILLAPVVLASLSGWRLLAVLNALALAALLTKAIGRGMSRISRPGAACADAEVSSRCKATPASQDGNTGPRPNTLKLQESDSPALSDDSRGRIGGGRSGDFSGTPCGTRPTLHPAEEFVRTGLMGIFMVDAGFLLAADLPHQAAAVWGLMILAWLWRRRWLQSTP